MATYTSDQITNKLPITQPPGGAVAFVRGRVTLTANPALSDVLEFFKLPKGAVVTSMRFWGDELDTHATAEIAIQLGHSTDVDAYGTLAALDMSANASSGTFAPCLVQDADAVATTQEETITGTISVAAATAATAPLNVYLDCHYTMEVTNS